MRKSQAPSLRVKPFSFNTEKSPNVTSKNLHNNPKPVEKENSLRSTESILDLILKSDDICDNGIFKSNNDVKETEKENLKTPIEEESATESFVDEPCNPSEPSIKVYNVVYGKQTKKKHKTWEDDGLLEVGNKYLTLKNGEGKVIGVVPLPKSRKLDIGERIYVGSKEVELLDLADEKIHKTEIKEKVEPIIAVKKIIPKPKKFFHPGLNSAAAIALPPPSSEHQWYFNENGLPITNVNIEGSVAAKLREHQIIGVSFLYECIMGFKETSLTGAILADEMGLGKTLQCIALVWTLLKQGPYGNEPAIKKALIVTPTSLTMNWYNEFNKWLGRIKLAPFVVNQQNKPKNFQGSVMIISYEMLIRYFDDVETHDFDLLICDEGHRLKNSNKRTTQLLRRLNCSKRIILTGTPIQNDLQEFYTLVDFVNPNVLGTPSEFRRKFEEPILASRQPNADEAIQALGRDCSQDLKRITSKFLLRRTRDILSNYLPPRQEVVVFCKITDVQEMIYNSMIDSFVEIKEGVLGMCDGSVHLELITALRKICSHPCLLKKENFKKDLEDLNIENDGVPKVDVSSKVTVTINFLRELQETSPKEKVVLVSNSTQTLDLLGKILDSIGYATCRLDGTTPAAQRNEIVQSFNLSYSKSFVFLLSSKAGGVGLNLTGASRLILFDSDWNPATDLQAIGRIWRDGQKYPVYIYRLLTTGTIEEKIYQRQISKQGLCEGTVDPETAKSIKLSTEELKDIFSSCTVKEDCLTHNSLSCECSKQGEIPIFEVESEEPSCQLMKQSSPSLKISELFQWEHHGPPFDAEFLSQLCLKNSENEISFIFRSCRT